MNVLGISSYLHNSSAALVSDGVLLSAVEEERLNKEKYTNAFPYNAINWCLQENHLTIDQIDVESARQIRDLISDMKCRGTTVFLTTHYIEDAQRICDRIAFIVNGKIVKAGTVEELMENAGHEHIIKLTLSESANGIKDELQLDFPNLRIEAKDENTCFITSPGKIALSPILQYLDSRGISVFEVKEIRPTLEDVFVKVTGIEAGKLKKEKEGGKK